MEKSKKKQTNQSEETKQASDPYSVMVLMEKVDNMKKRLRKVNRNGNSMTESKGKARNQNQCNRNGVCL